MVLMLLEYERFDARIRDLREQLMGNTTAPAASSVKVDHKKSFYVRYALSNCIGVSPCFIMEYGWSSPCDTIQVKPKMI